MVSEGHGSWAAPTAQYILLGGFAAVASGISSQGLTGFARSNMALSGPWPYLLFLALDGAAGVCAVLLARRAARGSGSLAPRLAVWGLTGASAAFNFTHAPRHPAAPEAYAMMPVVAAVLFEFCLQETRSRAGHQAGRRLDGLRWLHPAERLRVRLRIAADDALSADEATRRVRIESAARSLYRLREVQASKQAGTSGAPSRRARKALRRAHAALAQAGFADAGVATEVLRHLQVLTMTTALAALDYASADAAHAAIDSFITRGTALAPGRQELAAGRREAGGSDQPPAAMAGSEEPSPASAPRSAAANDSVPWPVAAGDDDVRGTPADSAPCRDEQLVEAARKIAADAAADGSRLSQAALARRLRGQGWPIGNDRLSWLAATIGLTPQRRG